MSQFRKRRGVWMPVCDEHLHYRAKRVLLMLGLLASMTSMFISFLFFRIWSVPYWLEYLSVAGVLAFWLFQIIVTFRSVRCTKIDEQSVMFENVHRRFVFEVEFQRRWLDDGPADKSEGAPE